MVTGPATSFLLYCIVYPILWSTSFKKFNAAPARPLELRSSSSFCRVLRVLRDGTEPNKWTCQTCTALSRLGRNLSPGHQFKSVPHRVCLSVCLCTCNESLLSYHCPMTSIPAMPLTTSHHHSSTTHGGAAATAAAFVLSFPK